MPSGIDYRFVRRLVQGSVNLPTLGQLPLDIPRGEFRRAIYAAVVFQGFSDFAVDASLELQLGGSAVEILNRRWGTQDASTGDSIPSWAVSGSAGYRTVQEGWPVSDVAIYPAQAYPNGINRSSGLDCISISSQYNGGYAMQAILYPFAFIGDLDRVAIRFNRRNVVTVDATPTVEVYLGCKTFTS